MGGGNEASADTESTEAPSFSKSRSAIGKKPSSLRNARERHSTGAGSEHDKYQEKDDNNEDLLKHFCKNVPYIGTITFLKRFLSARPKFILTSPDVVPEWMLVKE